MSKPDDAVREENVRYWSRVFAMTQALTAGGMPREYVLDNAVLMVDEFDIRQTDDLLVRKACAASTSKR